MSSVPCFEGFTLPASGVGLRLPPRGGVTPAPPGNPGPHEEPREHWRALAVLCVGGRAGIEFAACSLYSQGVHDDGTDDGCGIAGDGRGWGLWGWGGGGDGG